MQCYSKSRRCAKEIPDNSQNFPLIPFIIFAEINVLQNFDIGITFQVNYFIL